MPLIIGGLCVFLAVLVWQVVPRSPEAYSADPIPTSLEDGIDQDPVEAAIDQVNGPNPMAGILALKALAEAEPPNVDAVIELGRFSIQSGQFDKARERFVQALNQFLNHHLLKQINPGANQIENLRIERIKNSKR